MSCKEKDEWDEGQLSTEAGLAGVQEGVGMERAVWVGMRSDYKCS